MDKINFFTPISYGSNSKTVCQFLTENIDNYFYLWGKTAEVIPVDLRENREKVYDSWMTTHPY